MIPRYLRGLLLDSFNCASLSELTDLGVFILLPRMKSPVGLFEVLDLEPDVGVEAPEVVVAEEVLHVGGVGAVSDHPGGAAPPERVGRGGLLDAGGPSPAPHDLPDRVPVERPPAFGKEELFRILILANE